MIVVGEEDGVIVKDATKAFDIIALGRDPLHNEADIEADQGRGQNQGVDHLQHDQAEAKTPIIVVVNEDVVQ